MERWGFLQSINLVRSPANITGRDTLPHCGRNDHHGNLIMLHNISRDKLRIFMQLESKNPRHIFLDCLCRFRRRIGHQIQVWEGSTYVCTIHIWKQYIKEQTCTDSHHKHIVTKWSLEQHSNNVTLKAISTLVIKLKERLAVRNHGKMQCRQSFSYFGDLVLDFTCIIA